MLAVEDLKVSRIYHVSLAAAGLINGALLRFDRPIAPAPDDMIVVKLADGDERTLHVDSIEGALVAVTHMRGSFSLSLALRRLDSRSFELEIAPHREDILAGTAG